MLFRSRLTTEILGSVNNHVHYHSNVPTLTIDAVEAGTLSRFEGAPVAAGESGAPRS